jgi:Cu/Ag efflux protein CusF
MNCREIAVLAISGLVMLAPLQRAGAQQGSMDHGSMGQSGAGQTGMMTAQSGTLADGEIRKVDKDAGKLTIKHGPIPSIDMPPMTMVYRVKDAAMLDQLKPGDKVKFDAEKLGGAFTVTKIEKAQ